ncbi:MAG TPA: hypothetical protein PKI01_01590 [Bacteroidales bacterium]|nr:hypothetical protein [Bacteroidales bacterium]
MSNPKHRATTTIITGTISLCFCWFFWYPVFGIFISCLSIVFAIIAVVNGRKIIKINKNEPEKLDAGVYRNGRIGYFLGIAGLIISFLYLVLSGFSTFYFKFLI